MTERQQRFVNAYVADPDNATAAAIRAGYSAKTASQHASRLLRDVKVKTALDEARAPIREAAGVTLENHLEKLASLRDKAEKEGQYASAISAEVNRGKVVGLYVERSEVKFEEVERLAARRRNEMPVS